MNPILQNCRIDVVNKRIYYVRTIVTRRANSIRTTSRSSCKFYSNDESHRLEYYFFLKDVKFLKGNDAPRGGRLGNYYTFSNKTFFKLIYNE